MNTDRIPKRKNLKDEYERSEALRSIVLPPAEPLRSQAIKLEQALKSENKKEVQARANEIAQIIAETYQIPAPPVRVLGVRPRKVSESSVYELFGDYDTETLKIRLWMRTAVLQKASAYGTLLSTLCHEICHHLDCVELNLPNTYHTRGFYERAGLLYHHIRNTPVRALVWMPLKDGTFAINWGATMKAPTRTPQ